MASLLVVEDDQTIGDALRTSLRAHGDDIRWERTGRGHSRAPARSPPPPPQRHRDGA